ncbi:MAG: PH domain-containing protein [Patescibacteria group bacterium]
MLYHALNLEKDEHVIQEVRKHWIVFVGQGFVTGFLGLFPVFLKGIVDVFMPGILDVPVPGNVNALLLFLYSIWLLFLWLWFFIDWTKYYLDVWYVTEKRIIIVNQKKIFDREVSNLRFDKIQDITLDVHGFLSTLLNFGTIRVQTASEDSKSFQISAVRYPEKIRKVIFSQQNKNSHNYTSSA